MYCKWPTCFSDSSPQDGMGVKLLSMPSTIVPDRCCNLSPSSIWEGSASLGLGAWTATRTRTIRKNETRMIYSVDLALYSCFQRIPEAWYKAQCHSHCRHIHRDIPRYRTNRLSIVRAASSTFLLSRYTVPQEPFVSRQRGSVLRRTFRGGHPHAVTLTADYRRMIS